MAVIADIRCLTSIRLFSSIQGVNRISLILLILFASWICATPNGCDNNSTKLEWLRDIDLPDRPTQGPICGVNSCCGQAGEMRLGIASKEQVEKFIKDSVSQVVSLLQTRSRHLESFFKDMMAKSKKEFHNMFERTYGMIYLKNSDVFTNFFVELEKYYNHGGVRLTETMDHFFTILYQRMFRVINAQYDFDEDYLSCVARDIAKMKPFGDVPMKLAVLLKRSFVATRIFHRALNKGAIVAEKMLKLNISEECGEDVTRMQFCDYCTNQAGPGACNSYCADTIKSCLYLFGELDKNWDKYIDGLDKVADKLLGPFNIEMVVEPINIKISEAIMNFQESGSEVSQKVFVECGAPKLNGDTRRRRVAEEDSVELDGEITYAPVKFNGKKKHKKTNSMMKQSPMEKKIAEVKQKIKETRSFWNHLPYQYCNNITTAAPTEDVTCWNGTALGTYTSPDTKPMPLKPTVLSEQLFSLEVLVHKLKSAYQGQDEDLDDEEEEEVIMTSGSGSGDEELGKDDDFEVIETTSTSTTTTESIIIINSIDDNSPKVATASAAELTKALIYYILPIVMVWFGGAVTELL